MNYRQIKPSAAVARYVEFYWILEDKAPGTGLQRVIPDGRAGIILNFETPFESFKNGRWQGQPECFLVGQITGPLLLRAPAAAAMVGIQFRPHGATQLLRLPTEDLTDSAVNLEDLSRRLFRKLECVRDFSPLERAVAALDPILRELAREAGTDDDPVVYAVRSIEEQRGLVSMREVADQIGWSPRQLQRRFKEVVGISPKLFARMQRFQGVLRAMDKGAPDWVNAAVECGYYDQAHLIRDFRAFSGNTPTALLEQEVALTRRFLQP